MEIALRRGFIWPSYEIYGGVSGFYDYGPLGATLKKKIEDKWRELYCIREGFLEISSPSVAPEEVFTASGHVESFVDPMVECKRCGSPFRADHLIEAALEVKTDGLSFKELERLIKKNRLTCPECGGELSEVWSYNLMFKTYIGPGNRKVGYLRPETAQGMFVLFNRLYSFYRKKLPFGVAQLGRAYRNEISPRQGVIRLREFSMAEVEIFVDARSKTHENFSSVANQGLTLIPQDGKEITVSAVKALKDKVIAHELLAYHLILAKEFLMDVGIPEEKIRFRQHAKEEMAHYATECWDAEVYTDRFGWIEVVGIADRTCYDLKAHEKFSRTELKAFKQFKKPKVMKRKKIIPRMEKMGPSFKGKAGEILDKVKDFGEEDIKRFEEDGYLEIDVAGEKVRLNEKFLALKEVEESVVGEKITPHVIEPSYGIDRILYCILESAYNEREGKAVLSLKSSIAPIEVAVFPLVSKPELNDLARRIFEDLRGRGFYTTYDESDSIGRRYARVDEVGVPYAITVDFDSLDDNSVTLRERDSTKQVRIKIEDVPRVLKDLISGEKGFKNLLSSGKPFS